MMLSGNMTKSRATGPVECRVSCLEFSSKNADNLNLAEEDLAWPGRHTIFLSVSLMYPMADFIGVTI
jgi:hypothetical protein